VDALAEPHMVITQSKTRPLLMLVSLGPAKGCSRRRLQPQKVFPNPRTYWWGNRLT
jgi:hypothetical protein